MSKRRELFTPKSSWERLGYLLILLLLFVLGVGALGRGWYEFLVLRWNGITTEGIVVNYNTTVKGDRHITYRYEVPGPEGAMRSFERSRFVMRNYSIFIGEIIPVVYLPERPEISNVAGNRYVLIGDIVLATVVFGMIEIFVGILLLLHIKDWLTELSKK